MSYSPHPNARYLPPIGLEIPCAGHASAVPLRLDGVGIVSLDFKGGIRYRVEANTSSELGGVRLKVIGHEVSAVSPILGTVTMTQSDVDSTPLGILEIVRMNGQPVFRHTVYFDVTLTIEKSPTRDIPQMLRAAKTGTFLSGDLYAFPPQGHVYQLREPLDFSDSSDNIVAQIPQMPHTFSHNP